MLTKWKPGAWKQVLEFREKESSSEILFLIRLDYKWSSKMVPNENDLKPSLWFVFLIP